MQERDGRTVYFGFTEIGALALAALLVLWAGGCGDGGGIGRIAHGGPDVEDLDAGGNGDVDPTDTATDNQPLDAEGDLGFDVPLHIDVAIDHVEPGCSSCHGDEESSAPPRDMTEQTDTTAVGVGAHRAHEGASDWHAPVLCQDCHVVPTIAAAAGHIDPSPAELVWSEKAAPEGWPAPTWAEATCDGIYCHGAMLPPSGTNTAPVWTSVDAGQADCGTCHGVPPLWPHPERTDCESCHVSMGPELTFADPTLHINGTVETNAVECTSCHGSDGNAAPPLDTRGGSDTATAAVGAHRSHTGPSGWRRAFDCTECHTMPETVDADGHRDSPAPAELIWGPLATHGGLEPAWDGESCANTYCHGTTLVGAETRTAPVWTHVGEGESRCGACHGVPPAAPHPDSLQCTLCHPTLDDEGWPDPERHIDGVLDLSSFACNTCHGNELNAAPPGDIAGGEDTTRRGVGAHQSHLQPSTWRAEVGCEECHTVPTGFLDAGHLDSDLPAELTWGLKATLDGAAPEWNGESCDSTYCHGATLVGAEARTPPAWTHVGEGASQCGACHGVPPAAPHPSSFQCAECHDTVGADGYPDPARHIDGVLDLGDLPCDTCHGGHANAAPPRDSQGREDTHETSVGAHQSHLRPSDWRAPVDCVDCHTVPTTFTDVGHIDSDLPAELTWGPRAVLDGAMPDWNGTSCENTYCHGATLDASGDHTTPTWTNVGADEAACGTCHGAPPQTATHPQRSDCATCHPTMDAAGAFTAPERHVDGVLDVIALTCNSCHGNDFNNAPPFDTAGGLDTALTGVGAHQSHLQVSDWRAPVACEDCHTVPTTIADAGHLDSDLPAELTWGAHATLDGAVPDWNGTTCEGTYCHGSTLDASGINTTPTWTNVGADEAACDTCHGAPPQTGVHPPRTDCASCHPTMDATGAFIAPERHIDGELNLMGTECNGCHGNDLNAAPPRDTSGGMDTSLTGVGAHQSHMRLADWRAAVLCEDCHTVPTSFLDVGHLDTALPAELTFGVRASLDGATPDWNGTSCQSTYCHGATLDASGSNTTPTWINVEAGEAACGTCHGAPPQTGGHPQRSDCGTCHPTMDAAGAFTAPARHMDGTLDLLALSCNSCHGNDLNAGPPRDTAGGMDTALTGVGAHQSHLRPSDWRAPLDCMDCHTVPTAFTDVGHIDSDLPAELTWGPRAVLDGAAPDWNGTTCESTYCHGATLDGTGVNTTPTWTAVDTGEADCGTCHGIPPQTPSHPDRTDCATCHPTMDAAGAFIAPERHVDGNLDFVSTGCSLCHGNDDNPAPPRDLNGGTDTTLRSVGAHQSHLQPSTWRAPVLCEDCHTVPTSFGDPGHMDSDLPAELTFGAKAQAMGATPVWNGITCVGTYCHGSTWDANGTNLTPTWNRVGQGEADCGTCHGAPPTTGWHPDRTDCVTCHRTMAADGSILEPERHIDGVLDVYDLDCTVCHIGY